MNNNWIIIAIAIIQIIIMFAIGYWQINVAKSIARKEISKEISIRQRIRNFFSKYSNAIIKFVILYNLYIAFTFVVKPGIPTRVEILYMIFVSVMTLALLALDMFLLIVKHIKDSHEILYCMICKRSEDDKPACIDKINKAIDETET